MEMGNRAVWVQPGPGALRIYTGGLAKGAHGRSIAKILHPPLNSHLLQCDIQHLSSRVEPISFPLCPGLALSLALTKGCGGRDGLPVLSLGPKGSSVPLPALLDPCLYPVNEPGSISWRMRGHTKSPAVVPKVSDVTYR